ncbi:hypothetical protein NYE69_00970 [Paenibacillus sp. FSL R5-0527]|uniref:Putative lipoprotein n=1 Tax=Paenibacillus macerans TaxID=44252 RepID=A0A090Y9L8_PAEMA|nr:hypothetical protein [Paenibacillus macerans]KFM94512.1 putative lipoprotein [Paenibacillus macerans]MCY7561269.1 hypothetical protein [Paenibacillus macerans]MEC0149851.1 hypothetical protein [Paenibacillus macerans]MED4957099.1 hypothetical protein [Paenibacillus macerans]OMG49329.1 hypothetical protein BK140_12320 [Paenibacillus macerans]
MKKKLIIIVISIFITFMLTSCKPTGNNIHLEEKEFPFHYVTYKIFEKNSKVGELEISLRDSNKKTIIKEVKFLDGDKLPGIGLNIKNIREYEFSKKLILQSYTEREYLDDNLRYEDIKKVLNINGAKIVESTITEFKQQVDNTNVDRKLVLPPDSNLQEGSIYYVLFSYLEKQSNEKYHFYTDLDGSSGYLESYGQELINVNGKNKKNTIKLETNVPVKTELWYDQDTGVLLKKIEYFNQNYILRYEINLDSLKE